MLNLNTVKLSCWDKFIFVNNKYGDICLQVTKRPFAFWMQQVVDQVKNVGYFHSKSKLGIAFHLFFQNWFPFHLLANFRDGKL